MVLGHCPALQGSDGEGKRAEDRDQDAGVGTRQSWLALAAASLPDQEIDQPYPRVEMFSKHPLVVRIRAVELDCAALDRQAWPSGMAWARSKNCSRHEASGLTRLSVMRQRPGTCVRTGSALSFMPSPGWWSVM